MGPIEVKVKGPRVNDRRKGAEKVRFSSRILSQYLRCSKSLDDLIPWLYLKGVSTSDFSEVLSAFPDMDAQVLSASTAGRPKEHWQAYLDA